MAIEWKKIAFVENSAAQSVLGNPTGSAAVATAITVAEQTLVGRITGGNVDDLSVAQVKTLIGDVSDTAYGTSWDGVTDVAPSKNVVYDQMELVPYGFSIAASHMLNPVQDVSEKPQYKAGFWCATTASFMPTTDSYFGATFSWFGNTPSSNNSGQIAFLYNSQIAYLRTIHNNTPTAWVKILTANDVSDTAYAASWDGVTTIAPSKNAVYDELQTVLRGDEANILKKLGLGSSDSILCDQKNTIELSTNNTLGGAYDDHTGVRLFTEMTGWNTARLMMQISTDWKTYGTAKKILTTDDVSDAAYGSGWDGVTIVAPSKNAVYDEMELRAPKANPTISGLLTLSGGQIKFPATQSASSDVNTLDDYEEGEWTIGLAFGGGTTGITYSLQTGAYTKIGRLVTVSGDLRLKSKGSSTGNVTITGLPFVTGQGATRAVGIPMFNGITFTGQLTLYNTAAASTLTLAYTTEAGAQTVLTDANFTDTSVLIFTLTYQTG